MTDKLSIPKLKSGFSFGGPLSPFHPSLESPAFPLGTPEYWMHEAILEGLKGIGISNPNPSVGCVLVDKNNNEISRGHTHTYRSIHAERHAFEQAYADSELTRRLDGATAYVTLEPCSHQGYQGPCVDLILNSKIKKVVIAKKDPNPIINGKAIERLKAAGKEIEIGLFSNEVTAWNFPFFASMQLKRPIIALKWAQTLDGQLADDLGNSKWITGPIARAYTHWLRQRYNVILVGAQTALKDLPRLDVRDCPLPRQAQPLPVIFDPSGHCLNPHQELHEVLLKNTFSPDRQVVWVTKHAVGSRAQLKQQNVIPLFIEGKHPIKEVVEALHSDLFSKVLNRPLQSIFVEGGPKTLTSFFNEGFADLIHLFTAPVFTGGQLNRIQLGRELKSQLRFHPISFSRLGSELMDQQGQDLLTELVSTPLLSVF